jgi:hypothetical protein
VETKTCSRCGASSTTEFGYIRRPVDGKVFCAICWERDNVRGSVRYLGAGVAIAALLAAVGAGTALLEWFLWFPPLLFVLVAAHEAGHACAARLLGLRVPLVSLGLGRRIAVFHLGATRVDLHVVPLCGFAAVGHPGARGLRWRRFVAVAAGPAVNLGLAVTAARLGLPSALLHANLLLLASSLIPMAVKTPFGPQYTDGAALWRLPRATPKEIDELLAASFAVEAHTAYQDRRYEEAHRWVTEGLAAHPDAPVLSGLAGVVQIGLGHHREAYRQFAAELERSDLDAGQRAIHQNNLAWAALMSGDPELLGAALMASEAAHLALPWMPCVNSTRGFALIEAGQPAAGAILVRAALAREKDRRNRASMACELAVAAARLGDGREVMTRLAQARRLDPDCPLLGRAERDAAVGMEEPARP